MDQFVRRVYENGKVTIPKELRDLYQIVDGAYVRFEIVQVIPPKKPAEAPPAAKKPGAEKEGPR